MALNLFRSSLFHPNHRALIITVSHHRTHYTKTPNHHTKAKWRPFRREKILDVSSSTLTEDPVDSLALPVPD